MSSIERGRQSPTMSTLRKIAAALQVSVKDLIPDDAEPPDRSDVIAGHPGRPIEHFSLWEIMETQYFLMQFPFIEDADLDQISEQVGKHIRGGERRTEAVNAVNAPFWASLVISAYEMGEASPHEFQSWCARVEKESAQLLAALGLRPSKNAVEAALVWMHRTTFPPQHRQIFAHIRQVVGGLYTPGPWNQHHPRIGSPARQEPTLGTRSMSGGLGEQIEALRQITQERGFSLDGFENLLPYLEVLRLGAAISRQTTVLKPHKISLNRRILNRVFTHLAASYFDIYKRPPDTADAERGPRGRATLWATELIRIATKKLEAYCDDPAHTSEQPPGTWLREVRGCLRKARGLTEHAIARRLREGWHRAQAEWPDRFSQDNAEFRN